MGYCSQIPPCVACGHEACDHEAANQHPCKKCSCEALEFAEPLTEAQFQGGGGGFGGGGATSSW